MRTRQHLLSFVLAIVSLIVGAAAHAGSRVHQSLVLADFENGVDPRGSLANPYNLVVGGPWYAWAIPYNDEITNDDINYFDVYSNGNSQDDWVDYVLDFPETDFNGYHRLTLKWYAWCENCGTSKPRIQVFVHDWAGGNSDGNGFAELGYAESQSSSAAQVDTFNLDCAQNRGRIHQVRLRVKESFFSQSLGARVRVHLFNLSLSSVPSQRLCPQRLSFPAVPNFYGAHAFLDGDTYKMWATVADAVRYFTSSDGLTWSGGNCVYIATEEWERDGFLYPGDDACPFIYPTGISHPRVIKEPGGSRYLMFYTAGQAPNTSSSGGVGVAFSTNGTSWTGWSGNPLRAAFPGGFSFAVQALRIGERFFFYYWADRGDGYKAWRVRFSGWDQQTFKTEGADEPLPWDFLNATPLGYDNSSGTCWSAKHLEAYVPPGGDPNQPLPAAVGIYDSGDCRTTLGTQRVRIDRKVTGEKPNFDATIKERNGVGELLNSMVRQYFLTTGSPTFPWQPGSCFQTW